MVSALLLSAALWGPAACKKAADPGATPAPGAAPGAVKDPADVAEGAKLHAAIECLNRHSANVFEARDVYLKAVDPATGSSHGKKAYLIGLYAPEPCERDVKEAGALTPAVPALDAASAVYAGALEGVSTAWEAVRGYYQKDEYLDDKGKKAEEMHPKLMAAFKVFAGANKELSKTVRALNRARREAKLAAREKAEGRNLGVIMDSMMLEAETLVGMATSDGEVTALDGQIAKTNQLVDEVDTYAGAHKDELHEFGSMGNIKNYDKTFLAASKSVSRTRHDKKEPTPEQLSEVTRQYNYLVDNYNHH